MQLDFAFLKFAKNLKNGSPTVLHLTYAFWQTWHLMDQTWHFCIGTMAWQFWYPENLGLLVVPVPPRHGSFPWDESSPRVTLFFPRVRPPFFARHLLSSCNRRLLFLQRREARRSITASSPCRSCTTTPSSCWGSPPWGRRPRCCHVELITEIDRGEGTRDGRRNCTRKRKRLCDARENFLRRWKIPRQKCQVKNVKHLKINLFFPLAKGLGTWQTPTNSKF